MERDFISPFQSEFPVVGSDPRRVLPIALGAIQASIVRENQLVPTEIRDGRIVFAVSEVPDADDFTARELFEKVRFVCNRVFEVVNVTHESLQYARTRYLLGDCGRMCRERR